jgi:hypothetical protein
VKKANGQIIAVNEVRQQQRRACAVSAPSSAVSQAPAMLCGMPMI